MQGGNYLLTFMEKETDFLNDINTALEKNVLKIRNRQSDFLLSVIPVSYTHLLPTERAMLGRVMAPKDPNRLFSDSE